TAYCSSYSFPAAPRSLPIAASHCPMPRLANESDFDGHWKQHISFRPTVRLRNEATINRLAGRAGRGVFVRPVYWTGSDRDWLFALSARYLWWRAVGIFVGCLGNGN